MPKPPKARLPPRGKTAPAPEVGLRRATISQTKNHLSALLDRVRHGESILIVDREQPVARLVPVSASQGGDEESQLQRFERAGLIRRAAEDM